MLKGERGAIYGVADGVCVWGRGEMKEYDSHVHKPTTGHGNTCVARYEAVPKALNHFTRSGVSRETFSFGTHAAHFHFQPELRKKKRKKKSAVKKKKQEALFR